MEKSKTLLNLGEWVYDNKLSIKNKKTFDKNERANATNPLSNIIKSRGSFSIDFSYDTNLRSLHSYRQRTSKDNKVSFLKMFKYEFYFIILNMLG